MTKIQKKLDQVYDYISSDIIHNGYELKEIDESLIWEYFALSNQRIEELKNAIKEHRSQKADDRCIFDDDKLYEVLGDGIKCDRRVGNKQEMLNNCARFIERRCENGGWPTYQNLENKLAEILKVILDHELGIKNEFDTIQNIKTILDKHEK